MKINYGDLVIRILVYGFLVLVIIFLLFYYFASPEMDMKFRDFCNNFNKISTVSPQYKN